MKKNKLFLIWCITIMLILFVHISMTLLYNAPVNPITHKYNGVIQNYMNPLFQQNWRLFAPNPVSNNNDILVKGYYQDGNGEENVTEWLNVNKALIDQLHRNRLTSYRLAVAQTTTTTVEAINNFGNDEDRYKELVQDAIQGKVDYPIEMLFLKNISSEALYSKYGRHFDNILIRVHIDEFADYYDYIKGNRSNHETFIEFPRMPYEKVEKL